MSRRDQMIVIVVVAIVALGAFYLGLLSPKLKESKSLDHKLTVAQQQRSTAESTLVTAQAAQTTYVSNVTTISSLEPAIPATDSTSTLLRELDSAAHVAGVNFNTITLSSAGGGGAPSATPTPTTPTTSGAHTNPNIPPIPPGYSSGGVTPTVTYTLAFSGNYLKLQKFLAAMEAFVKFNGAMPTATGRLLDAQGISVQKGTVSLTVTGYLLSPSDQVPLPVPQGAPAVPGIVRASAPGTASRPSTIAMTGAHS